MKRSDDVAEFEELFHTHWNNVYQLCFRYCQDSETAKDLTQNIFGSVWQRRVRFESDDDAGKYLAKAARYQSVDYWRTRAFIASEVVADTQVESAEQVFLYTELTEQASLAINTIPEPSRSIFLLSRDQEYTYAQIARQHQISPKTVEFHISRALRLLREKLRK